MPTHNREILRPGSTPVRSGVVGFSSVVDGIIESILSPRETVLDHRAPKDRAIHQLRRCLKGKRIVPVHTRLRISMADIDDEIPTEMVLQSYREEIAYLERYAAQKARRDAAGVLPFADVLLRAAVRETKAEGAANVATQIAEIRQDDLIALRNARRALQAEGEPREHLVQVITDRIVALEMAR